MPTSVEEIWYPVDLRVRPTALLQGIFGLEIQFPFSTTLELGPSVQYLNGNDDLRSTLSDLWELGVVADYLVYSSFAREGVFVSAGFYDFITRVDAQTGPRLTNPPRTFQSLGLTASAGYQWNLRFFHSDAWTLRLGAGFGHRWDAGQTGAGGGAPAIVRQRTDPMLDFSLGVAL